MVVPTDEDLEEGVGHEHEGVGSESGEFRDPLVEGEGKPLAGAVDGGFGDDGEGLKVGFEHVIVL